MTHNEAVQYWKDMESKHLAFPQVAQHICAIPKEDKHIIQQKDNRISIHEICSNTAAAVQYEQHLQNLMSVPKKKKASDAGLHDFEIDFLTTSSLMDITWKLNSKDLQNLKNKTAVCRCSFSP